MCCRSAVIQGIAHALVMKELPSIVACSAVTVWRVLRHTGHTLPVRTGPEAGAGCPGLPRLGGGHGGGPEAPTATVGLRCCALS